MCDGTHKLAQGSKLAVLYPIQRLGVIASNGTLGLSRGKGRDTRGSSGGGEKSEQQQ